MNEKVVKRMAGAMIGIAIGVAVSVYISQITGYDVAMLSFITGLPLGLILSRAWGGPLSEAMGRDERASSRNLKLALLSVGILSAIGFGAYSGNIVNGLGLGFMFIAITGPRYGQIFDERMGRTYSKAATMAFSVFSLCASYIGFYQATISPELVTVDNFMLVIWISWASLLVSWAYYYFIGGE